MPNLIAVVGDSGTGKSTSMKYLNPKETVIINVAKKPLPFRGWKLNYKKGKVSDGNYFEASKASSVVALLNAISAKRPEIKNIIVDDAGYLMTFEFMSRCKEKGYDKFADIAEAGYKPVEAAMDLRDDLNVIFTYHCEPDGTGGIKIKTSGKFLPIAI